MSWHNKKQIAYTEVTAPDDQCYHDLWPEIIGTNCWICTSHKRVPLHKIITCPKGMVIIHKCDRGGGSKNGCCINPLHLKIGTAYENMQDMANKERTWNQRQIYQKHELNNEIIKVWKSMCEAARELKIRHQGILACCQGKHKTAGGYKWEYVKG